MNEKSSQHFCILCGRLYSPQVGDTGLCPACAPSIAQSSLSVSKRSQRSTLLNDGSTTWQEGQTLLETYEVKGVLGEGGMGTVYRVHHNAWNIDLALKQPKPDVVAQAGVESFVNEAQAWVDLGLHPHIATCHYVRKIDELPCVFAELVEGGSLADWIKKGKLRKLEDMLDVAIQFAWGLHYAHELGMIHQDVKPANVLMKEDGVTKVTDFGLVKAGAKGRTISSGKGTMLAEWSGGTQAYFSPEQSAWVNLAGQAQQWADAGEKELSDKLLEQMEILPKPTRRTDLWSWGLCVLEMFNGKRGWAYGSAALESLETYLDRGPAVAGVPAMPPAVGELLLACFQEDPNDRPHDMQVVADRLIEVYREVTGKPHPRQQPKAADLRADSLNNKALSLLDLEKEDEAVEAWQAALKEDPHHAEVTYNYGVWRWQAAQQIDLDLVQQLEAVIRSQTGAWMPYYLLGLVHMQRRDIPAARQSLKEAERLSLGGERVLAALRRLDEVSPVGFLHTLEGHRHIRDVEAVAITPDGRQVVSGSSDKTLRVWDLASGKCVHTLEGHTGRVENVAITPDGRQVVSGGNDPRLRVWDLESGECLHTLEGHKGSVEAVAITPDGRRIVSGSADNTLRVWDLVSGECLRTLQGHKGSVEAVAITPDGRRVVSGSWDKTLRVWDLASGECLRTLEGHKDRVTAVAISPDRRYVVSGSWDKTLRVWDLASGECLHTLQGHGGWVKAVAITPDGRHVVSGSQDTTLRVWNLESGKCVHTLEGHKGSVEAVAITSDGRQVVSGCSHGRLMDTTLRVWNLESGECLLTLEGHTGGVKAVAIAPDGRQVVSGSHDKTLRVWDLESGKCLHSLGGHTGGVKAVAITPDGRQVVSGSLDGMLLVWQLAAIDQKTVEGAVSRPRGEQDVQAATLIVQRILGEHEGSVYVVAITPDGRQVVSGGRDHTLRVWDLASGECLRTLEGHKGSVQAVAISPDGRYVVSGSWDKTLRVWDLASGKCVHTLEGHTGRVENVAISPDGRQVVSGCFDKTLRVWNLASGECLRTLEGHTHYVYAVAITPDGRYVVSGSEDNTLRVWNLASGECLRILEEHTHWVLAVAISSNGRQVVSGSKDGTLQVWDLASGECLRTLEGHTHWVNAVAITPDGRQAVSGSDDETMRVWQLSAIDQKTVEWAVSRPRGVQDVQTAAVTVERKLESARLALQSGQVSEAVKALREALLVPSYERDAAVLALWHATGRRAGRSVGLRMAHVQRTLQGHKGSVQAVAISPDGRQVVSGSYDNTLRVWDLASGECLHTLEGHKKPVHAVAVSPDGRQVVSGSEDHTLRVWDLASGECLHTLKGHTDSIFAIAITPDGRQVVSGSDTHTLHVWDLESGKCLRTWEMQFEYRLTFVAITPDGSQVISGSEGGELEVWDLASGECLRSMEGHKYGVFAAAITPDGRQIVSPSVYDDAKTLWVRDLESGKCLRTLEGHKGSVEAVAITPDGRQVVSGSNDKTLRVWDLESGKCLRTMEGHEGWVETVAITPDGRQVVSGSDDETLRVWALDWDYEFPDPVEWDEGARPYLEIFLILHTAPYVSTLPQDRKPTLEELRLELIRLAEPGWNEADFQQLLVELGYRGYGWLRPEGVRQKLDELMQTWEG